VPGLPTHLVQRGNNRQEIFLEEADYRAYLYFLDEARKRYFCAIHAYVLMTNHVHLLLTPRDETSVSRMIQNVGRRYVPYVNKKYGRTGTLWEGRFKASTVERKNYLLACYRYIEMNPVRAGIVGHPGNYVWSSYRSNALGNTASLLTPHAEYLQLGTSLSERTRHYRAIFESVRGEQESDIRAYLQSGTPLGNDDFRHQVEAVLSVRVGQVRRGRPGVSAQEKGL